MLSPPRLPADLQARLWQPATAREAGLWGERLRLLLESTGEGVYGIDMDGRCTFINRAGAELLGYAPAECMGRNMHDLVHHRHPDGAPYPADDCPIFNAFRAGVPCRIDSEVLWRADGSAFPAEYSSYPILDGGLVRGAVVTFVDISERKRGEAAVRQARDELEQRVAERTQELTQRSAELAQALAQVRELSAYTERVREEERTRIAREIHDELGSLLVALKMDVGWLERRLDGRLLAAHLQAQPTASLAEGGCPAPGRPKPGTPPRGADAEGGLGALRCKCQTMRRLIDNAVENVGRIITDLRPSILDHQGLWAALEWQAQEFKEATELRCDFRLDVADGAVPPDGDRAMAVFRIFQEMLSNVARHAQAHSVRIRVRAESQALRVDVLDDGRGAPEGAFDSPQAWGVLGMRERAGHFGGHVVLTSEAGVGTLARLVMPLLGDAGAGAAADADQKQGDTP